MVYASPFDIKRKTQKNALCWVYRLLLIGLQWLVACLQECLKTSLIKNESCLRIHSDMFLKPRRKESQRAFSNLFDKCLPSTQSKSEHRFHKRSTRKLILCANLPSMNSRSFLKHFLGSQDHRWGHILSFRIRLEGPAADVPGQEVRCPVKRDSEGLPLQTPCFSFLRDFEGRLNVAVCKWFYFFWEAAVKWPK